MRVCFTPQCDPVRALPRRAAPPTEESNEPVETVELGPKPTIAAEQLRAGGQKTAWGTLMALGGLSVLIGANQFLVPATPSLSVMETVGDYVDTVSSLSHLMLAGKFYADGASAAKQLMQTADPLQDVPLVTIDRPVMIVPGWTTKAEKFDHLVARLTEGGRNGGQAYYVRHGQVFSDKDCTQPTQVEAGARVFVVVFDDVLDTPDQSAPQIGEALEVVARATGSDRIDTLGYSLGGLASRVYLEQGGERMGRLMILGTGNHGTRFAELATRLIEKDVSWAMNLAELNAAHLPAMRWMASEANNPRLQELNRTWTDQLARTEGVKIVGSDGLWTPSMGRSSFVGGDGMVESNSLAMPGVEVDVLPGKGYKQHGNLPNDSAVYREMAEFFNWR
ncbi:MAG: esterase/lipase family protein [Vulcanimicrobiota bacterium]